MRRRRTIRTPGSHEPRRQKRSRQSSLGRSAIRIQWRQLPASNGVDNPTFTDVRGYYQFGPRSAVALADAKNSDNLEEIVQLSPQTMAVNGITATTTVGDWRQSIANRMVLVAGQSVLN